MSRFTFPYAPGDLIGAHLSTQGGLHRIFERASAIGATAAALFAKNGNQWQGKPLTDEDCAAFASQRSVAPLLTHASYLINLAGTNRDFHRKSIAAMTDELDRAERLGIHAVVLHPGAHLGAGPDAGVDRIARSLDQIHAAIPNHRVVTLLETGAGQGTCVGCTFEELGRMIRLVDDPQRVGICFDTCHVFAAGYEMRTRDGYERTMDDLIRHVGLDNVGAFHLNDSKKPLGSRVDRHTHIGEGELGLEPFRFLVNDPRFARIPKVIETPKDEETISDQRNLRVLRSLVEESQSLKEGEGRCEFATDSASFAKYSAKDQTVHAALDRVRRERVVVPAEPLDCRRKLLVAPHPPRELVELSEGFGRGAIGALPADVTIDARGVGPLRLERAVKRFSRTRCCDGLVWVGCGAGEQEEGSDEDGAHVQKQTPAESV